MAEHTSAGAALELAKYGIPGVKALVGGIGTWVNEGNPLVTGTKPK